MKVLVLDNGQRSELEPVPETVEVVSDPTPDVEFAVLNFGAAARLPQLFAAMPGLRVVQSLSAGVDWLQPHVPQGVVICKAVGVHDGPVAEWVVAAILAMQRRLPEFIEAQQLARWDRSPIEKTPVDDLEGQMVLVVGHGSIGRTLASRLAPFGVRVIGVAQHARPDARPSSELPSLLAQADVVVNLLPLAADTEEFVDRGFLDRMKAGALFVNAGRGKTVDTAPSSTRCVQAAFARRLMSPTLSRCRTDIPYGTRQTSSSPRTSPARRHAGSRVGTDSPGTRSAATSRASHCSACSRATRIR